MSASASAFYTDRRQLLVRDAVLAETDPEGSYVNRGFGRSFGAEALLRAKRDNFFGWLAYTVSRSERRDLPGTGWRKNPVSSVVVEPMTDPNAPSSVISSARRTKKAVARVPELADASPTKSTPVAWPGLRTKWCSLSCGSASASTRTACQP